MTRPHYMRPISYLMGHYRAIPYPDALGGYKFTQGAWYINTFYSPMDYRTFNCPGNDLFQCYIVY
jgi:hypothetical protein